MLTANHLGISPGFMANFENFEDYATDWPFLDVFVSNEVLESEHPAALGDVLSQMNGIELEDNRFLSFALTRKRFLELSPDLNSRSFDPSIFEPLAAKLLDLVLFVQKNRTSSVNWGETTLEMLCLEKIDFTRKVVHLGIDEFVMHLTVPSNHRLPLFPKTKELSDVLGSLRSDIVRFRAFRNVLEKGIEEKILSEHCPLRFSFGKIHEVYVYAVYEDFPPTDDALKIFDRGLIGANLKRIPVGTLNFADVVQKIKIWLQENRYGKFSEVASSAQDLFDKGKVKTRRSIPRSLRTLLEDCVELSAGTYKLYILF